MTKLIRRVVTTHHLNGRTAFLRDDHIPLPAFPGGKAKGAVVWTTGTVPADNLGDVEGDKRAAGMSLKGGSVLRVTEFGPGFTSPMHRTLSIDYAVILSGTLELVLDSGQVITLQAGDTVVQRGTHHAWRNPSQHQPCLIMIAMIEALPITIAGKILGQTPAWRMIASVLAQTLQRQAEVRVASEINHATERLGIRRIVTGHDARGKATVLSEGDVIPPAQTDSDTTEAILWRTEHVPTDNTGDGEYVSEAAALPGSAFRVIDLMPGCSTPMRRDNSVDYCMLLSGNAELVLEGGACATLRSGDTAVLRGTRQFWRNTDLQTPCRIVVCTIEARPSSAASGTLDSRQ